MANIYFSDWFGLPSDKVEEYGAFDISLVNDLPLFVDPFLLFNSEDPEYQALHKEIIRYMRFLKEVSFDGPIPQPLVDAWFTFPEVKQNWLGFSQTGNEGHGLGTDFARALNKNLKDAFKDFGEEIISCGSHLEKLCLIREGVGRDNISDFTTNLIKKFLLDYTQEFAQTHLAKHQRRHVSVRKVKFNYGTRSWVTETFDLPFIDGDFVLLTPKNMLTKDEAWINRPDLLDSLPDIADALPDAVLRAQVNDYLFKVMPDDPKTTKKDKRDAASRVIEKFPEVLDYYIREKEDSGDRATSIAETRVHEVETRFVSQVRQLVSQFLDPCGFYRTRGNTYDEAQERLNFLKDIVENKGGHKIFYMDGRPIERENDLHILYRLTWHATPSDVSREVNDGRGPADFKISRGADDKTIVEFKLAKNTHLEKNLAKQAEIYEQASDATHPSLKAIFYFNHREFERVFQILKRLKLEGNRNIFLIDASIDNKPSGSKA